MVPGAAAVYLIVRACRRRFTGQGKEERRPKRDPEPRSNGWLGTIAGAFLAALVIALQVKTAMDRPDHIAQRYDDVFHLNAVRYIVETGNASTLNLGRMLSPDRDIAIYPSAWHSVAALVGQLAGLGIPVSVNMLNIVIAALVWPLCCMFLVRSVVGRSNLAALTAAVLATVFPAFPLALFEYGTLFPNMLSYSILPVALGLLIHVSRLVLEPVDQWHWSSHTVLLGIVLAGLVTAQPNGLVALLAMFVPIGLWIWWMWARPARTPRDVALWRKTGVLIVVGITYLLVWGQLLLSFDDREPFTTGGAALGAVLTGSVSATATNWFTATAIAGGLVVLASDKRRVWLLFVFVVPAFLYVVAASVPPGPIRMFFIGSWYQDAPRLAALTPMVSIVVAVAGFLWLRDWAVRRVTDAGRGVRRPVAGAVVSASVMAFLVILCATSFQGAIDDAVANAKRAYSFENAKADVLSLDERKLIEQLPELVPEDTVLGVNPWNGGALAYAYTGIPVSQYHMDTPGDDLAMVAQTLDAAVQGSDSCSTAQNLGIEYVLDFGDDYLLDFEEAFEYPAFDDVTAESGFELVRSVGEAELYRIAKC
ncbi:hypothetical protein GCM10009784_16370 [Arthrobacter parietis]|uniref:Glycosyltransferase RgtA/B/C/D-like domain-containing protein n=1 Tax=Arthrobacter parietis TaxID=271434 RepID=A0ABP5MQE3_9MICC